MNRKIVDYLLYHARKTGEARFRNYACVMVNGKPKWTRNGVPCHRRQIV